MAKVWIGANEIIEYNSKLETYNELYGNGYLAKLTARMQELDKLIAEQDKRRADLAAARKAKQEQTEEREM